MTRLAAHSRFRLVNCNLKALLDNGFLGVYPDEVDRTFLYTFLVPVEAGSSYLEWLLGSILLIGIDVWAGLYDCFLHLMTILSFSSGSPSLFNLNTLP